ncbi:MAG: DUF2971 domain-containing protein [Proteobacteria bacterium]|nr:DUF2971 domain-containing protein [Pseudomonadota bacterium]
MRVYHFLSARWALDDLAKKRLRISSLLSLNDPFEFLALALPAQDARKRIYVWRHLLAQRHGILCFSRSYSNPLLWSHYADKHAGICLGFDVSDESLVAVNYVKARAPQILLKASGDATADHEIAGKMRELLSTKYADWAYEDEIRAFASLDPKSCEDGHYFLDFSRTMALREIQLGPTCKTTRAEVEAAYGPLKGVVLHRMRLAFNTFRVVRNKAAH